MYLGIDIGGTYAKLGVVENNDIKFYKEVLVNIDNYSVPIIEVLKKEVEIFIYENKLTYSDIKLCGVSATGQIDKLSGVVVCSADHMKSWQGTKIKEELENLLGVEVSVINDANAMILGEMYAGSVKGYEHIVGITLGTGIGGGIVVDSKLLEGRNGFAGEVGHIITNFTKINGKYNRDLSLEGNAATSILVKNVEKLGYNNVNGKIIFDELLSDERVREIVDVWIDQIVVGLASLVHIFNPQIIVIGGGISARQEEVIEPIKKKLLDFVFPSFAKDLEIVSASLGNKAGLYGAVGYAREKYGK